MEFNEIIITFISVTSVAQLRAKLPKHLSTIQTFSSCAHKGKHPWSNQHFREVLQGGKNKTTIIKKSNLKMRRNDKLENWLLKLKGRHFWACFCIPIWSCSYWLFLHFWLITYFLHCSNYFPQAITLKYCFQNKLHH